MARDDRSAGEAWLAGAFVGMQQLLAREGYADLRSDVDGELRPTSFSTSSGKD